MTGIPTTDSAIVDWPFDSVHQLDAGPVNVGGDALIGVGGRAT
jgi:hypothetical protein